jgi:hypothetical protein
MKSKIKRFVLSCLLLATTFPSGFQLANAKTSVDVNAAVSDERAVRIMGADTRDRDKFFARLRAMGVPSGVLRTVEENTNKWLRDNPQLNVQPTSKENIGSSKFACSVKLASVNRPTSDATRTIWCNYGSPAYVFFNSSSGLVIIRFHGRTWNGQTTMGIGSYWCNGWSCSGLGTVGGYADTQWLSAEVTGASSNISAAGCGSILGSGWT